MPPSPDPIIQTNKLSRYYGDVAAVVDLNLTVHRGEVFGFLGPNGAGKTTTIRTLLDFIRPTSGSATMFGLDSVRDGRAIRARTGYLPSELTLLNNWTGVQYVQWLGEAYATDSLPEAQRLAALLEFDLTRSLKGMSSGMKRKMGIIAALAHKPDLLILDEPSSGLDPLMQQVFQDLIREIRAEGRTVFLSSHNLPEVGHICDRVGIIRGGRLQAVETIANLTRVAFRWVTFSFEGLVPRDEFVALAGVTDVNMDGSDLQMKVSGDADMRAIIRLAADTGAVNIDIVHPTLEEIFLTYYGETNQPPTKEA
jgi:ABC-2 type transport system ATP-binding protein